MTLILVSTMTLGLTQPLSNGYPGSFPKGQSSRGLRLTTHLCSVLGLSMHGATYHTFRAHAYITNKGKFISSLNIQSSLHGFQT
jgi:hypothetical protein